jgi:hypothetical protein
MRGPSSFRGEIAAFRERLDLDPATVHVDNRWRYEFTMVVLDRLARHVTEKTWNKIKPSLPVECSSFITAIIQTALVAKRFETGDSELPDAEAKVLSDTKRFVTERRFDESLDKLQLAQSLLRDAKALSDRLLSREKTAPRQYFMVSLRAWFQEGCGKPHDNIVAMLTNVVFDLQPRPEKGEPPLSPEKIEVSGEAVRSAYRDARARQSRDRATQGKNIG